MSDQTVSWRVGKLEDEIKDVKEDFKEQVKDIRGDIKGIERKIDYALSDEGAFGKLSGRMSDIDLDKKSWQRAMIILGTLGTAAGGVISFLITQLVNYLGK